MAITQDMIDALNTAIATGERQVALGAQQITYRSIAELISARDDLLRQLQAEATAASGKPRQTRLYQSGRGY